MTCDTDMQQGITWNSGFQILRAEYDKEFAVFWAIAFFRPDMNHSRIIGIDACNGNISETGIIVEGNCWASSAFNQIEKEIYLIDCEFRKLFVVDLKYFAVLKRAECSRGEFTGSYQRVTGINFESSDLRVTDDASSWFLGCWFRALSRASLP